MMTTVLRWTGREARALRQATRLSVRAFAEHLGVAVRTVSKWEAAGAATVPRPDFQAILDTALRQADDETRHRFDHLVQATTADSRPGFGHSDAESIDLLDRVRASDLSPGTLDGLDEMLNRFAAAYFVIPPATFREQVLVQRRDVTTLLDGRATLRQRRRLYAITAGLAGLLAEVSLALGVDAHLHAATALSFAEEAGHHALAGWVRGTQAQIALHDNAPRDAVTFALAGVDVAPAGSSALVRAHTYLARARARCDDRQGTETALADADTAWNRTGPGSTIFSLSPSYLPYCATTAYVWLGDAAVAQSWARQSVDARPDAQPTVGRALAHADLAIALAQSRERDEAADLGMRAIDISTQRLTAASRRRIAELITALGPYPGPRVTELRERWQWISG